VKRAFLGAVAVLSVGVLPLAWPARAEPLPTDGQPECGTEGSVPADVPASKLRIATFNVLHTQDDVGEQTLETRVPLLVQALADARIDVAGLQEVAKTTNHGSVAQRIAQGLAATTGVRWHWCWFQSNPHFPGEPDLQPGGGGGPLTELMATQARAGEARFAEGVAVISRLPITSSSVRRMPPRTYEAPFCVPPDPLACNAAAAFDARTVLHARVAGPQGPLDLYTTHVAHGLTPLSDTTKLLYANLALRYVDETAGADSTPDLLVGDFNSLEGSAVHNAVTAAGYLDTFRAANPDDPGLTGGQDPVAAESTVDGRIDYVFARPGGCGLAVKSSEVIGDAPAQVDGGWVWPSDHYGVVSELRCA
jgi:endonuclease/exonuclease/phosphatase family metal-dependent hydrolase